MLCCLIIQYITTIKNFTLVAPRKAQGNFIKAVSARQFHQGSFIKAVSARQFHQGSFSKAVSARQFHQGSLSRQFIKAVSASQFQQGSLIARHSPRNGIKTIAMMVVDQLDCKRDSLLLATLLLSKGTTLPVQCYRLQWAHVYQILVQKWHWNADTGYPCSKIW